MTRDILHIYTDIGDGDNNPSFHDIELTEYTYESTRMGMPKLSATLMYGQCLDEEWTGREYVVFGGERYYIRDTPTSSKSESDMRYKHELVFRSERDELLANVYFFDVVRDYATTADKPCSNSTTFTFYGNLKEFVDRLNCAFVYAGVGDSILKTKTSLTINDTPVGDGYCAMIDMTGDYDLNVVKEVSFSDQFLWDAISQCYETFKVPFEMRGKTLVWGAVPTIVNKKFKYGPENELLSIAKENANAKVINRITMVGSTENIPYYYPNDTEYGHLTLTAKPGNSVLTTSMINVVNRTQLLASLRNGQFAILTRYSASDAYASIKIKSYQSAFEDDIMTPYTIMSVKKHEPNENRGTIIPWHVRVNFDVAVGSEYVCNKITGWIWTKDRPQAGSQQNLFLTGMTPETLYRKREGSTANAYDLTTQIRKTNDSVELGYLQAGNYEFTFTIWVPNLADTYGNNVQPVLSFAQLSGFAIADKKYVEKNGYYWSCDGKDYKSGALGIELNTEVTDAMIGDGFGWTAQDRMPFQEKLMPPIYRLTNGAERFYNAVNYTPNLALNSDVKIDTTDYSVHQYRLNENIANGEKVTVTVWGDVSAGKTLRVYNTTGSFYQAPLQKVAEGVYRGTFNVNIQGTLNIFHLYNWPSSTTGRAVINKFKVERGDNTNSDWTLSETEAPYLKAYRDGENPYVFPNPYQDGSPREHIYVDEDAKPTIEGVTNANGDLLGEIVDIAYDEDDNDSLKADVSGEANSKNDSANYEHSYFYVKLNIFNGDYGFDLFAHASQTDAMTLQMRSGSCNGCKFKIQTYQITDENGLKTFKNPVQVKSANGDIVDGGYTDKVSESVQAWQQDTTKNSIWICVQKDAETFGEIIPNNSHNYKPAIGDKFNIINIDFPQVYIDAAEKKLEQDGLQYMADNNVEKFNFSINASRIFFAENPDVLAQLNEYSKLIIEYNGKEYEQFVSSLTIASKNNEALPDVSIELADTLSVGESFTKNVAEQAISLLPNSGMTGGKIDSALNLKDADLRYLSKQKSDRTPYKLSSDTGFEVGDFMSGFSGGIFNIDPETGKTYIETDYLKIRMKAIFERLMIANVESIGGKLIITPGGSVVISFVEEQDLFYRCYFKSQDDDKGVSCRFVKGDLAYCQEWNVSAGTSENATNQHYWRLVVDVNNDGAYIDISKSDCEANSDTPKPGDTICQLGNIKDDTRQSAIILSTVDDTAPCVTLYNGIDYFELTDKAVIEYGVNKTEPFFNCYGRFFFGPKSGTSYLQFEPSKGQLVFRGKLAIESTVGDTNKNLDEYVNNIVNVDLSSLQSQIDGVIETWFGDEVPTLENEPANEWADDDTKKIHVDDMYYDTSTGTPYRFAYSTSTGYYWTQTANSGFDYIYADIDKKVGTKAQVFFGVFAPTPPYNLEDLWVRRFLGRLTDGTETHDELWRCTTARKSGSNNVNDWSVATYYDNTQVTIDNGIVTAGTVQLTNGNTQSIVAGITGGEKEAADASEDTKVRIWAGASKENRFTAPFRVLQNGTIYASTGVFEGEIFTKFKNIIESHKAGDTDYSDISGAYTIKNDLKLMSAETNTLKIRLPRDEKYIGARVTLCDSRSNLTSLGKMGLKIYSATDSAGREGLIYGDVKKATNKAGATEVGISSGVIEFIGIPFMGQYIDGTIKSCDWVLLNMSAQEYEYNQV